ncbi:phosphatase PAP2 family protein [Flavobacterium sp. CBA20B-1]|uniref:phosphatase PAP2 family protein n=1 Tax=Flavobacterium sp. CBA20B-1 TaxID=2918454 RepID=UPI002349F900|nr:phosphatase PAP2 family protein [Flavobacterium sp. CBA20B-1]WCM40928.1 phosphatase PAP2 family protein [Flavobacterium sp. CBA20B-1]
MLEHLIQKDQQLLIYLNNLGTEFWDPVFMYITHQINWWPFFLLLIFLLLKKISLQQFGLLVLVLTVFFVFTDQFTNLVKYSTGRLRPVNDPLISPYLRILRKAGSPSFFSGHASNSSGSILIIFLILKKYYKYAWVLFFFPLLFAYTRIYLGLHYPLDIICGYIFGISSGFMFFFVFKFFNNKYHLKDKQKRNLFHS